MVSSGAIGWNFRRLMQVKAMESSGVGLDEGMKKLRPPVIFHQAAAFKDQVRSYSLMELEKVFEVLLNSGQRAQVKRIGGRLVLERMILRIVREHEAAYGRGKK